MAQAPSRCINHPERTAVARCKQCHKPLCEKCVKKMPGGVFCSDECYENMAAFQNRVKALDQQKKRGFNLGKWLTRAAVLIVVAAALYYVVVMQGVRNVGDFLDMLKGLGR
jgi:predicted nucleic acid-binding Zn ribbon protein